MIYKETDLTIRIKNKQGQFHNEDGPAVITYFSDNSIEGEHYFLYDRLHNENGPCITNYRYNGSISYEEYRINDLLHNEDGPAEIWYNSIGIIVIENYFLKGKDVTCEIDRWSKKNAITDKITPNQLIKRKMEIGI